MSRTRNDAGGVSRRALLLGAGGLAALAATAGLVEDRGLRHDVRQLVRPDPQPPYPVPSGPTGAVLAGTFRSRALRRPVPWTAGYPPGSPPGTPLPVFLVLHGRGNDHRDVLGGHRLGAFLAATVRAGTPPFVVVGVDGGDHSYWHRRRSGEDPQAMILELLPVLADRALHTARIGLGGWSMGGYGALLLAERLGSRRVAVCAVDSPALWRRAGDTAPGAFDGPADFHDHDVIAQHARLRGIPLRIACGTSDPFLPGVRSLLAALPAAERDLSAGGHDVAFWQHAAPAQLAFVGTHLGRLTS